ncbi:MAG TPA: hypothetical protein VK766_05445 [Cytophagaceae bacterium]|jgi:hypothetical protein|nr:hypothetical protein [Cytophagaceae bacterium]
MKTLKISLVFLVSLMPFLSISQTLNLKLPIKETVQIGKELKVQLNPTGVDKYQIIMDGNPASAYIENNTFTWTPKLEEKRYYLVKFQLQSLTKVVLDEIDLELTVDLTNLSPYLVFDRVLPDTIKLAENESFSFAATIKSRQNTDPRMLMTYFTFNEDQNIRNFDSCRISVNGDQLLFYWTPSNREAIQEYIKFRITILDTDNAMLNQVLNFRIKNKNQDPYFLNDFSDTLFIQPGQPLMVDYEASDPDNDKLNYDYTPKNPLYSLQGTNLVFQPINNNALSGVHFPLHITLTVSDGKATIKRNLTIFRSDLGLKSNESTQPVIGDFTKKVFSEGDSVLTYLNISNYADLTQLEVTFSDLTLPKGIKSLASHLVFEKKTAYIKVYSKGIIPYSLVDRDYNYNISVTLAGKDGKGKPAIKVLVLTIINRPDPNNIGQQRDTLNALIKNFLKVENNYKATLDKIHNRINRPWWKKVAIVTGTLSGVLTLIQSQNSNKKISAFSATISLVSIMVSSIPSLSEKTVSDLDGLIANSNGRINTVKDKAADFKLQWSLNMDQDEFEKTQSEIEDLIEKNQEKRKEDICAILENKKLKRKIERLTKQKSTRDNPSGNLSYIFQCDSK